MAGELIECVPNFSEGRRLEVIEEIIAPFRKERGCVLLDYRADPDHNRLVVTIAGEPKAVQQALLEASLRAVKNINMENHRGSHPRIGAVDVIPFVPLRNISMMKCVELSLNFGRVFNQQTGIPVYFYEESAQRPERRRLEVIRKGQYETLKAEVKKPERHPDIGKTELHPTAGATVIGARKFLIAYNVNLDTENEEVVKFIAKAVRASSGGFCNVKGIGIYLKERGITQVSMNITDFERNPLYRVTELIRVEAKRWGIQVLETEVYGMIPAAAIVESLSYYLQIKDFSPDQVIELRLLDLI
ncbi:MAG: glutamate formimidoyltransferase [Spirochaetes bacterium]|nr:MAG: glutamate formimidoyltransferase [Spirochaetota bacterium]